MLSRVNQYIPSYQAVEDIVKRSKTLVISIVFEGLKLGGLEVIEKTLTYSTLQELTDNVAYPAILHARHYYSTVN